MSRSTSASGPLPEIRIEADRRRLLLDLLVLRPDEPSDLSGFRAKGLIDSGATVSGIGPRDIAALGLRSYGKNRLGSATEERLVDYYLFRIGVAGTDHGGTPSWPYLFDRIDGFSWSRDAGFGVIVGMDILLQCELRLAGHVCTLRFG